MNTEESKPWLDLDGKIYNDEQLIQLSREWSAETWELFLESTVSGVETRKAPQNLQAVMEESAASADYVCRLPEEVKIEIRKALRRLPVRERSLIKWLFWENLSQREVARRLQISLAAVQRLRNRSLSKFKRLIEKMGVTQTIYVGSAKSSPLTQRSKHEEIYWAYKADLRGGHGL